MISPGFVWAAVALPPAGFASYVYATLRGKTKPNRVSWALWAAAPLNAFPAEIAEGTPLRTALVTLALGAGPVLVLVASLANPQAYWKPGRLDRACGALAAAALAGWAVTRQGDVAIALSIAADGLAAVPTVTKSWSHPESESVGTYVASGAGAGLTLLTISHWQFASAAFPLYVMAVCAVIAALLCRRPARSALVGLVTRARTWRRPEPGASPLRRVSLGMPDASDRVRPGPRIFPAADLRGHAGLARPGVAWRPPVRGCRIKRAGHR